MLTSPSTVAARYRAEIKQEIRALSMQLKVVGFLAGERPAAASTRKPRILKTDTIPKR